MQATHKKTGYPVLTLISKAYEIVAYMLAILCLIGYLFFMHGAWQTENVKSAGLPVTLLLTIGGAVTTAIVGGLLWIQFRALAEYVILMVNLADDTRAVRNSVSPPTNY